MTSEHHDLIVRGGTAVLPSGEEVSADIGVSGERIAAIGDLSGASADEVVDAKGLHVLPGVIDTQVHFREPGGTHKEDLDTGTRAAIAGGVTTVFEMPNTSPSTTTAERLQEKVDRARGRAWCDHGFFLGACAENADILGSIENTPGCCGIKIFMGSSTGTLLVPDDDTIRRILAGGKRRVAVHCEDEVRLEERKPLREHDVHNHPVWRDELTALNATRRLVDLAHETGRRVHVLHVTSAEEMAFLRENKGDIVTVETTPQHLTLSAPDCYDRLGTYAQMNPPIRDARHRPELWKAVADGTVDVIGSDHAPHTHEEKGATYPDTPSGMPGVQTLLPILLQHRHEGRLTLQRVVELTATAPARIYGIRRKGRLEVGADADMVLCDLDARVEITDEWIESRCGWTPFHGHFVTGWPMMTILRGRTVMRDRQILGEPGGKPVEF